MTQSVEKTIHLQGEWQIGAIGERLSYLVSTLDSLCAANAPGRSVGIDLSGVSAIDPCGCQLLLLFVETLKMRGITPLPCGISQELGKTLAALGFASAFQHAEKETEEVP